jgi:membrane protease YdiL (CAAX protease family)
VSRPGPSSQAAICLALATFGLGTCTFATAAAPSEAIALVLGALGLEMAIAAGVLAVVWLSGSPARTRLGLGPGRLPTAYVALLSLGMVALSAALDGAIDAAGIRQYSQLAEVAEVLQGIRGGTLALAVLGLGVAPGVAEELLCRGLVQKGLVPKLGPAGAILAGATVFGVLHMELVHGVLAAILGLYLGIAAYLGGSVRTAIACHVVNNLVAVALSALDPELSLPALPIMAGGLFLAAGSLVIVWRTASRIRSQELQPGRSLDDP